MSLNPGARLGVYEIAAPLGAGGMGEVYRARDTNLGRSVAIKILPESVAGDTEREARFEREAHILASLNHPHIAAIYGLEQSAGTRFLVLELVDGETLAQHLARRASLALPVDEAVAIARQIADALQAAHDKGIIHRDLKPANIALTADGQVKVLDFGLAKFTGTEGAEGASGSPSVSQSPTLTVAGTQAGMILGTAAYMSPEQAKGRVADKRCDIWSFGCVLFEMLAGRRPFEGEDISDTLAAILRGDPDWALLPAGLPPPLRTLVEGCLKKDRAQRIGDIAVAQFLLNQTTAPAAPAPIGPVMIAATSARGVRVWKAVAAVLALTTVTGIAAAVYLYRDRPVPDVTRFLIAPPEKGAFVTAGRTGTSVAISPDGRRLAYTARDEGGKVQIWLRPLDALTAQPLPGTDNAEFPFWSPDSRSLAYFANGKLLKIDAGGGAPLTLCDADGARGGTWGPTDLIVFGGGVGRGLYRIASNGGAASVLTTTEAGDHRFPSFLPGGRHVLFYHQGPPAGEAPGLYVVALDSPQPRRLTEASTGGVYAQPGVVLFGRQATLLAQPFDLETLSLSAEATPIAERIESGVFGGIRGFSVSDTGTLAYGMGSDRDAEEQLTWFDRQGKTLGVVGQPGNYFGLDLSPDEKSLVVHRHDQGVGGDLWLVDLTRNITSRFTFDPAQDNWSPVWSSDGRRIAFSSLRNGNFGLFVKPADGASPEVGVLQPPYGVAPRGWVDDSAVVYTSSSSSNRSSTSPANRSDVNIVSLAGERATTPLLTTPFYETTPALSPDGKWLAYSSDETGRNELYVRPFPSGSGKWQVSSGGGAEPRWRGDSREIFYLTSFNNGSFMAVEVDSTGQTLSVGTPRRLFDSTMFDTAHPGPGAGGRFAVSRDGQRILLPRNPRAETFTDPNSMPLAVVTNWAAALGR